MLELFIGWHARDEWWRKGPLQHAQQMLSDFKLFSKPVLTKGWVPLVSLQNTFHGLHQRIEYLPDIQVSVGACEHDLM